MVLRDLLGGSVCQEAGGTRTDPIREKDKFRLLAKSTHKRLLIAKVAISHSTAKTFSTALSTEMGSFGATGLFCAFFPMRYRNVLWRGNGTCSLSDLLAVITK